ncbi:MAG: hypothetical protein JST12_18050 [Armatimonadetes bacterium]|nr:hypothetical protein [Armatimonadota bacterium]MBS1729127.1 hypothetical protein [Armatimonadota bacterium]
MKLYDRVEFVADAPDIGVSKGMVGTLVDINEGRHGYELAIELSDDDSEMDLMRYVTSDRLEILRVVD